ncbi:MAG: hypothetical protein JWL94_284 [Microbacteriaceae bacterium]|nr:hypothetical protein [Microbacteriaceae bacterium]
MVPDPRVTDRPLWQRPVSYGAIGGTKSADLLTYPPSGFRPVHRRKRIGHGENRFAWASAQTLSWGIQRLSGFTVEVADAPADVTEQTYRPVAFDDAGTPIEPAEIADSEEATFGPDGTAFLVPGDTATLAIRFLGISVRAPVRVVYVIDEPNRKGFAYGTLAGHPQTGEESFVVEKTEDGSVWLTVAAFSRPGDWYWWMLGIPLRLVQGRYLRRYLRVLSGPTD